VANRELGTIERVSSEGDLSVRLDSGREVQFNIREHAHLDHGYAVTSHSSQGQTAERVLIHVDTDKSELLVNNRFAYVSVSRAQHDAQIYTNDGSKLSQQPMGMETGATRSCGRALWYDTAGIAESHRLFNPAQLANNAVFISLSYSR
jgi:hypothetical protein